MSANTFQFDMTDSFPHLASAPIAEAVIHWRSRAGHWRPVDELKEILAQKLPDYPHPKSQQSLELEAQVDPYGVSSTRVRQDVAHGLRLVSADKLYIVQFTRDGVVFSRLAPYDTWDGFSTRGRKVWDLFQEIAEPSQVERLGVRFINRIPVGTPGEVGEYLKNPPEFLETASLPIESFLYQSRHSVPGQPFEINIIRTIQPPTPQQANEYGLIVDIDVGTTSPLANDEAVLEEKLEQMHQLKNQVFFKLMSQSAIESFQKGTS